MAKKLKISKKLDSTDDNPIRSRLISMFRLNRKDLHYYLKDITDDMLDFSPDFKKIETIGGLLYHIAAVDWSWIFEDIDGKEADFEKWKYGFATRHDDVDQLTGKDKQFYIDLIDTTREEIIERLEQFSDDELQDTYIADGVAEVTVEWVCYHLLRHEAKHIGQISLLKRLYDLEMSN